MRLNNNFIPLSLHPTFFCLLGLIVGIFIKFSCFSFLYCSVFFMLVSCCFLLYKGRAYWNYPALIMIFYAAGYTLTLRQENNYALFNFKESSLGYVEEIIKTGNQTWPYRTRIKTILKNNFFNAFLILQPALYIYSKKYPSVAIADHIDIKRLSIKSPPSGDFKKYLLKEGISGTAFVYKLETEIVYHPSFSVLRWLNEKKQLLISSLKKKMSRPVCALFCSLFLGESNQEKKIIQEKKVDFKVWGIVHHLARSGLHLAIFILCWFFLLSFLPIPFFIKHILLTGLSIIYFLLSTPSISFIRAFHLFLLFTCGSLLKLPMTALHALIISGIITLLYNPYQLFFLDFQLSFYLTFCLAWLARLDKQKKYLNQ